MSTQFSIQEGRQWKAPFFTIWSGQAISLLGSQLVQFALIWHLTVETGSATVLATATLVALLPQVVLGPFVGALVDRWNRRVIMILADSAIALATVGLAILFALDLIEIWHIYLLMFVRSLGGGFHGPAMAASTSLMVPQEHLTRVQGINQTLNGGLNVISAPLGAIMLGLLPIQGILAIDVGTAVIAILPLFFIDVPQPQRGEQPDLAGRGAPTFLQDFRAGLRYVLSWPGLLILLGMAALINFLLTPAFSLVPLLVKDYFGGDALQLGWVNSALGIGVILGGLTLGIWGGFKRRMHTALLGLFGIGLGNLLISQAPPSALLLVVLAAFIVGFMQSLANGPIVAVLQAAVDPQMQGRVFTLTTSVAAGMAPLGLAIAGPLADYMGVQTWFLIGGLACVLMGVAALFIPAVVNIEQSKRSAAAPQAVDG